MSPAGQMETMDWLHALEGIHSRLDVLKRTSRNHAQAMSVLGVQQNRTNQAQEEVTREVTRIVDAANGNYSRRFEEASNNFETVTESIQFLHGRLVHVDTAFMEI